jgi:hypothetical protein
MSLIVAILSAGPLGVSLIAGNPIYGNLVIALASSGPRRRISHLGEVSLWIFAHVFAALAPGGHAC